MIEIKTVSLSDAEKLLEIYSPYVENTAISFEWEVPEINEFKKRISNTLIKYPYIKIEDNGDLMGYAYASPFKMRRAYDRSVETSIYIRKNQCAKGYGKALYLALEKILAKQNILNMNACVAYTENEDEYLTNNSTEFHLHLGYSLVGKFSKCGYKFNRWYDMVWLEKMIGEHTAYPKPVIPFPELNFQCFKL